MSTTDSTCVCACVLYVVIDTIVMHGSVTYTAKGGRKLQPIPLCAIYEMKPGTMLIQRYRAYADVSPLFLANGLDMTETSEGMPTWKPRSA
jgi:hypothetical protein